MIVYYQLTKTDPESGKTIYCGEDTYPYASPDMLIAADGLGGSGSWVHDDVDQRITDEAGFYDLVFAPVFPKDPPEEFKKYVRDCFREIFLTKDYFFDITEATKTSAYYASRLTSCITAYELNYDDAFDRDAIFDAAEKEDAAALQAYGDKLAEILKDKLTAISKNLNLHIESNIMGTNRPLLLPSTLQAAILKEEKDCVKAVYFWAGDSRAYVWDKSEGVSRVTEDHEVAETMVNLVSLSKPFRVETRYLEIKKPCIFFNTSDGFYKGKNMDTFGLENVFLNAFIESDGFDAVAKYWADYFDDRTKHDDSNTMALWAYGYANYDDVKKAAEERMLSFKKQVLDPLPDIITGDYGLKMQNYNSEGNEAIVATGRAWLNLPCAKDIAKKLLIKRGYKPYKAELERRIEEAKAPFLAETEKRVDEINAEYDAKIAALTGEEEKKLNAPLPRIKACCRKLMTVLDYKLNLLLWDMLDGSIEMPVREAFDEVDEKTILQDLSDEMEDIRGRLDAIPAKNTEEARYLSERFAAITEEYDLLRSLMSEAEELEAEKNLRLAKEKSEKQTLSPKQLEDAIQQINQERQGDIDMARATVSEDFSIDMPALKSEVADKYVTRYCHVMPRDIIFEIWDKKDKLLTGEDLADTYAALKEIDQRYMDEMPQLETYLKIESAYQKTYKRYYKRSILLSAD